MEPVGDVKVYGNDRVFVYLRQTGELDAMIKSLREAGHPVLDLFVADLDEVGAEIYRWEIATVAACSILGVNAFDQPNVEFEQEDHEGEDCRVSKERQIEGRQA